MSKGKIGVFDSGYGGLTILKKILNILPDYNFLYLGDNARTPYGTRSFETVYKYTSECVAIMFEMGCELIVLACNTASSKALRTIQQKDLLREGFENKRVLGVIRPTIEAIYLSSSTGNIGILATPGTVSSLSYPIEIQKMYGDKYNVYQTACPMFVPLVENNEIDNIATQYFAEKYIEQLFLQNNKIDTIVLACTHYPVLKDIIQKIVGKDINIISQGEIIAQSLEDYLIRHSEITTKLKKENKREYYTTDDAIIFEKNSSLFMGENIICKKLR